jgi:arylsulfatase A-like enzyme
LRRAAARRPDIFIITVESFNALYAAPAAELNPALTEDVMPYFRSLDSAGFQFTNAYTSSAYTFNGIVSVLCSQYTISEAVWGRDCLPETLRRAGYDPFAFISIKQLRPYRYDHFGGQWGSTATRCSTRSGCAEERRTSSSAS